MKRGFVKATHRRSFLQNSRGQIWVETMTYTLIAFALIGLVLAFVKPRIEVIQDRGIIQQSINVLGDIDSVIGSLGIPGNQRVLEISIKGGEMTLDGENDRIFFNIESGSEYSEPGENVSIGNVVVRTETRGDVSDVSLTTDYSSEYDIQINGKDEQRELSKSPTPYKVLIENQGEDLNGKTILNMEVIG